MRLHQSFLATLLLAGPLAALATPGLPEPITVRLDVSKMGKPISPDLFGVFIEDLNYTADGGLYAELVQNRSFEYNSTEQLSWTGFTGWTTVARGEAKGQVAVRSAKPLHPNNPHYLSIDAKVPGQGFGVSNAGFDAIPLKAGDAYEASFFAHQLFMGEPWAPGNDVAGRPMPVRVVLESEAGEVLAEASVEVKGRDWTRYAVRLLPSKAEAKARLVLLLGSKGGIAVDEISLFPEKTFGGRKNGLREDLAQAVADLRPKFVRFPGGCLAHGDGLNNIYRWKDTVGPVEQRRGQRNIWGYHQSVGLGYYEYFQFCEDIGAKPLPVVAAGVSCQNSNFSPGHGQQVMGPDELKAYIQDLLDLIEWANGSATSRWGAVRAAAGHPAPFGLKYLGLGNEDAITPGFEANYRLIQEALRAAHPEIVVIGTVGPSPAGEDFEKGWSFARKLGVAAVDEHYYCSPDWFWKSLGRYDGYDRKGPKVYVGEYAAHEKDRRNTLQSALAEAAACTSFERNGDVVLLSSYAPLLSRRGHTQWTPDLIYFTGTEVYPSINYEVQRLFCRNAGDFSLATQVGGVPADARLAVSAVSDSASGDIILKVVNGDAVPRRVRISLDGAADRQFDLRSETLSGDAGDVANEDGKPPAGKLLRGHRSVSPGFEQEIPANSLTVLRLH